MSRTHLPPTPPETSTLTPDERAIVLAFGIHDDDVLTDLEFKAEA